MRAFPRVRSEPLGATTALPEPPYDPARPLLVWLLAGTAVFTLVSGRTGDHIVCKVSRTKQGAGWAWFVYGRGGPHDPDAVPTAAQQRGDAFDTPWFYVGQLFAPREYVRVVSTRATGGRGAAALKAVNWFLERVHRGWDGSDGDVPARLLKSVKCARCRRLLTDPESIRRGLGAECWQKHMGGGA